MATRKSSARERSAASRGPGAKRSPARGLLRKKVKAIPRGFHAVTPSLVVRGADRAIAFYKNAFGAKERNRMPGPDGKLMHAEIQIGDSIVMLADEFPEMGSRSPQSVGGASASLLIYTKDVDALFQRALSAGATVQMPLTDMFWGDRYAKVVDPFGHEWELATHVEDVTPKEMAKRGAASMSGPPQSAPR
jgi:PhnB protein